MITKTTISVSTECYDEILAAMKAVGLETTPDSLTIKRDVTINQPIDFRLATIRRDCLVEAVKLVDRDNPNAVIELADSMYNFVIGHNGLPNKQEWK
jgi:hypothetical protein